MNPSFNQNINGKLKITLAKKKEDAGKKPWKLQDRAKIEQNTVLKKCS